MTYEQVYKMVNGLQKKAGWFQSSQDQAAAIRRRDQMSGDRAIRDRVGMSWKNHPAGLDDVDLDESATPLNRQGKDRLSSLLLEAGSFKDAEGNTRLREYSPEPFELGTDRFNIGLKYLYQRRKQNIQNAKDPRKPVKVSPVPEYFKDPVDRRWLEQAGKVAKNKVMPRKSMVG